MAASPTTDAVLSRRLQERDHAAWEELYAAYGLRLRAFALRLTRDPHDADDLVQETFVRALPRLDRMDADEVDLRAYLFTTLRNTFLKSCERGRRVAPMEEVPEPDVPSAIEDDPERSLLLRGQIVEVRIANASLAPRQRLALALRELEDCSYAEIGEIVGIKENAVAQLISRARESLRSTLRLAQVDPGDLPDECRGLLPQLSRHLDGQLRGEQLQMTLAHLEGCEQCQAALGSMREASRRYRGCVPPLLPSEEAHAAAIDAELTAAGYWRPKRSGAPRRSPRRVALITASALVLGGGGALVLASATDRADRAESPRSQTAAASGVLAAASPTPAPRERASSAKPATRTATADQPVRTPARPRPAAGRRTAREPAQTRRAPTREKSRSKPRRATPATPAPDEPDPGSDAPPPTRQPDPDPDPVPDTTPPAVDITSTSTPGDKADFGFAASESGAALECALDGGAFEPCTSPKGYTGLASGAHSFAVRATDAAGNTGPPDTHAWRIAEPRPDLVIASLGETGFTVANTGTAPAGSFVVTVTFMGTYTFAGLPPGGKATRTWTCRTGRLDAIADRSDTVAESDEANNRRSLDSTC